MSSVRKPCLNQIYQQHVTLQQHPEVNKVYEALTEHTRYCGFQRPDGRLRGRRYDAAVLIALAGGPDGFRGKTIFEAGARDGIFGAYLTHYGASHVTVSDYFEEWGKGTDHDLGSLAYWKRIWEVAADDRPGVLSCKCANMLDLEYEDSQFDIVVSTSVIEHLHNQSRDRKTNKFDGDIKAMRELVRICKPDGMILLSTDIIGGNNASTWHSGTFYFTEKDLFRRLMREACVGTDKCVELLDDGRHDFSFESEHCTDIHDHGHVHPVSSAVFGLRVLSDKE